MSPPVTTHLQPTVTTCQNCHCQPAPTGLQPAITAHHCLLVALHPCPSLPACHYPYAVTTCHPVTVIFPLTMTFPHLFKCDLEVTSCHLHYFTHGILCFHAFSVVAVWLWSMMKHHTSPPPTRTQSPYQFDRTVSPLPLPVSHRWVALGRVYCRCVW